MIVSLLDQYEHNSTKKTPKNKQTLIEDILLTGYATIISELIIIIIINIML